MKLNADEVRLDQLEEQYHRIRAEAVGLKSPRLDKIGGASAPGDAFGSKVSGVIDVERKLVEQYREVVERRAKVLKEIQDMEDWRHVKLLSLRYIEHKRLEEIALVMNFSYPHIKRIHGEALDEFARRHL